MRAGITLCLLAIIVFAQAQAFYGKDSPVVKLGPKSFKKKVLQSDELWLVEFYAPWCGHCKRLAPEWSKAATELKDQKIHIAAIDADKYTELAQQHGIEGFPTIKVFGYDKTAPKEYEGGRTSADIVAEAKRYQKQLEKSKELGKEAPLEEKAPPKKPAGFYDEHSDVFSLGPDTFDQVLQSDELWLVEFYAPWCGHCKRLAPEWSKAATELKDQKIHIAAIDADGNAAFAQQYGIEGFPTIKVFGYDKTAPKEYEGGRTSADIVAEAKRYQKQLEKSKELGKEAPLEEKAPPPKEEGGSNQGDTSFYSGSDVVQLTDDNFETEVLKSRFAWLVEFYAPWCGHCKNLLPEWKAAATELLGVIKIGAVDSTAQSKISSKYGIQGFPTIKFFAPGTEQPEDYEGGRSANDIVQYARRKGEMYPGEPPKVDQIQNQEAMDKCFEKLLCVVFVLPNIADTGAAGRNALIESFVEVAGKLRARPANFGWIQGGDHEAFENAFGINVNYPTWIAVNQKKGLYATHRGRFEAEVILGQLKKLLDNNLGVSKVAKIPSLEVDIPLWDGKDYVPPPEE